MPVGVCVHMHVFYFIACVAACVRSCDKWFRPTENAPMHYSIAYSLYNRRTAPCSIAKQTDLIHKGVTHGPAIQTRSKQAQACNTAPCLRISDIFT